MAELLFILTIVFVAYVVIYVVDDDRGKKEETKQPAKPEASKQAAAVKVETAVKPKPAAAKKSTPAKKAPPVKKEETTQTAKPKVSKPATAVKTETAVKPKPAAVKKPTPAKKAPIKVEGASNSVKNPETGEVAKIPNNYRFTKRWIKDALVAEGLLDKVYKNNELDDAATAKINDALEKLKAMEKYQ